MIIMAIASLALLKTHLHNKIKWIHNSDTMNKETHEKHNTKKIENILKTKSVDTQTCDLTYIEKVKALINKTLNVEYIQKIAEKRKIQNYQKKRKAELIDEIFRIK